VEEANPDAERWILIAEDNLGDVTLIRHALKHHGIGCKVVVMKDGDRASKFIDEIDEKKHGCPALIILDLNLPRKSGRDLLKQMRLSLVCKDVPVVVFSSSQADTDRKDVLRLGANLYITKPSELDEFLKIGSIFKSFISGSGPAS
jgi:DNA-binding response OmpR family regulator